MSDVFQPGNLPRAVPRSEEGFSVVSELLLRAAPFPEDPWLFVPDPTGWDWCWSSYRAVLGWTAAAVRRLERALEAHPEARPDTVVSYRESLTIPGLVIDLAVQAAGCVSAPSGVDAPAVEPALWACWEGETVPEPRIVPRSVPPIVLGPPPGADGPEPVYTAAPEGSPAELPRPGGALIRDGEGRRRVSAGALLKAARSLDGSLREEASGGGAPRRGRKARREITVLRRPLSSPLGRLHAAWSASTGAATLLEPDPSTFAATVAWARPTVLAGDGDDLARVWAALEGESGRRRGKGLPWGRLHTWILPPGGMGEGLAAADGGEALQGRLEDRGVRFVRAPSL